jgi:general secretion pathway protein N
MHWRWLALGLALYVAGLLAMAPATLLDARLASESHGRLRLAAARGTLWAGRGRIEVRDADGRSGFGMALGWRLSPRSLLRARLAYEIEFGSPASRFLVAVSPSQLQISNVDIRLPAEVLGLAVPKLAVLDLTGELQLKIRRLSLGRGRLEGDALLLWRDAGSALTKISPLGDYELGFEGAGTSLQAVLRSLRGPILLAGSGHWAVGARPELLAIARIPERYRDELSPLLQLIAVQQKPGEFALQLR